MGEVQGEIIMAVIRADYLPEQHVRYAFLLNFYPIPCTLKCVRFGQDPSSATNLSTVVNLPRLTNQTMIDDASDLEASRALNLMDSST